MRENPNGKLRICIDTTQTINRAIRRPKYTKPTIKEKPPLLTNANFFTIFDVSEDFHTIELDKESSLLATFSGDTWSLLLHQDAIWEDICVSGCGNFKEEADLDHDKNLTNLSKKCCKHYIRLTITINGHKLTDKGVEPDPAKVHAITKMPTPTDKAGVQRLVVCANN